MYHTCCTISYKLIFNLHLKNKHVRGFGLTRWSLGIFMGFFHLFCILRVFLRVLLSSSEQLILNKESWEWVFAKVNLFSNNLCFLLHFDCLYQKCKKHWKVTIFLNTYETQTFQFSVCILFHIIVCKLKAIFVTYNVKTYIIVTWRAHRKCLFKSIINNGTIFSKTLI